MALSPHRLSPRPNTRLALGSALLASLVAPAVSAQTQSLAFTGGVLLNPKLSFRRLGAHDSGALPGPATGGAVDRTYDDGYNRVDDGDNADGTTANWGYQQTGQVQGNQVVMTAGSAAGTLAFTDVGDFIEPSGHLEYRGSLGPVGESDWGLTLGIGYQSVNGSTSASLTTDVSLLEDAYDLAGTAPADLPAPPYLGTGDPAGVRIGAVPNRGSRNVPGGRLLNGRWQLDAEMIPITGGFYFESQLSGRLNGVLSAGVLAMFINADFKYRETSTVAALPPVVSQGSEGSNDVLFGGFVQLGLDWALWERASLVANARWQPAQTFDHGVGGREAEIDFTSAFAVHAGFAMRF